MANYSNIYDIGLFDTICFPTLMHVGALSDDVSIAPQEIVFLRPADSLQSR